MSGGSGVEERGGEGWRDTASEGWGIGSEA